MSTELFNRQQPKAKRTPNLVVNAAKEGKPAELFVYDDIGPDWMGLIGANTVAKALKDLGDVSEITVRINSPGGSVFEGVAIYNQLKNHKAKVNVEIDGLAASIASIIAMSGDVVRISENAMMMIHDPLAFVFGNSEELSKTVKLLDQVKTTLVDTYAARTGEKTSPEDLGKLMTAETWFTAKETLERGLVDEVSGNKQVSAYIDPQVYAYKHVPDQFKEAPKEPEAAWRRNLAGRFMQLAERE